MKLFKMLGTLLLTMCMYVLGFCLFECPSMASGFSYNGVDKINGQPRHDKIKSVAIYNLATSQDVKGFITSWNISVHEWLKNYVYLRMIKN